MLFTFKSCFIVCLFFLINTDSLMTIQKVYDTFSGKKKKYFYNESAKKQIIVQPNKEVLM